MLDSIDGCEIYNTHREPVLRETASIVTDYTNKYTTRVVNDLVHTMRANELIGMAAPQISESARVFVSEIRETPTRTEEVDELRVYINPKITYFSRETKLGWEGCGSIPGIFGKVTRSSEVTIEYIDISGVSREMHAAGLLARVIQHETDHLNGVLFTDIADPQTFVSREYYLEHIVGKQGA